MNIIKSDPVRDYLLIIEDKINKGYGAYWWCLRSTLLKQMLEVQLRNFNHDRLIL